MVHLVYCDNAGKKGEKELDKILAGTKTMVMRGGKSLTAGSLRASAFISWKRGAAPSRRLADHREDRRRCGGDEHPVQL